MKSDKKIFLGNYNGETIDELIELQSTHRVDSLIIAFEDALSLKHNLSTTETTILAIESLDREVNNGGFHQFFVNRPEHAHHTSKALREIGCPETADLLDQAIKILGIKESFSAREINEIAIDSSKNQDEELGKLDELFYRRTLEDISGKLFQHIVENKSDISFQLTLKDRCKNIIAKIRLAILIRYLRLKRPLN